MPLLERSPKRLPALHNNSCELRFYMVNQLRRPPEARDSYNTKQDAPTSDERRSYKWRWDTECSRAAANDNLGQRILCCIPCKTMIHQVSFGRGQIVLAGSSHWVMSLVLMQAVVQNNITDLRKSPRNPTLCPGSVLKLYHLVSA